MSSPIYCPIDGASSHFGFRLAHESCSHCGGPMQLARALVPEALMGVSYEFDLGYADAVQGHLPRYVPTAARRRAYNLGYRLGRTAQKGGVL